MNLTAALDLLLTLITQAARVSTLIARARAEGRDLSEAEVDELVDENDAARNNLLAAIERAKAEGR